MTTLRIVSGGAAQGLVGTLAPAFERDSGCTVAGTFGAVGAMAAKLRSGDPADLVILTSGLIADLAREGHVQAASAVDLGTVETGVAVRAGDPEPAIGDLAALGEALAAADEIYLPDPHQSTAGIHFAKVLRSLGLWDEGQARLRPFPNGATAMRELARSQGKRPIGCTQVTEILITPGVALVRPLPPGAELSTVYTAAVVGVAEHGAEAQAFAALLTSEASREARMRAGFR
jgi:molybdate transport system substrate-binding protein